MRPAGSRFGARNEQTAALSDSSLLELTLRSCPGLPCLTQEQTYFRVLQAVSRRRALIHGELRDGHGGACAIGSYFEESGVALPTNTIDEIAAYNDSFPNLSRVERWRKVMAWLRYKVKAR